MNDDFLHNIFTSKSPWSHNHNDVGGGADISANVTAPNNTGSHNSSGNGGFGGGSGGSDKSDKPSVAEAIFHTMLNNPFGQKVLAAILLTVVVYTIYLAFWLPTMMDSSSDNPANTAALVYSTEYEDMRYRKKPSLIQKLFCRGGKTSSFCSTNGR